MRTTDSCDTSESKRRSEFVLYAKALTQPFVLGLAAFGTLGIVWGGSQVLDYFQSEASPYNDSKLHMGIAIIFSTLPVWFTAAVGAIIKYQEEGDVVIRPAKPARQARKRDGLLPALTYIFATITALAAS